MYVLLGPQRQVELQETAADVAAFFISNRSNVTEWLVYRQMNMPEANNAQQLLAFLMLEESIREQSMQAVRDNFPGVL